MNSIQLEPVHPVAKVGTAPPAVSVIIPVYNRAAAVRRAIDSVLAQTFSAFEVIVVDDGSTDDSANTARSMGDSRVRVVCHERNLGGSAARNTGIRASCAPFIAFLDSDDEWLPTKLERQMALFAARGDLALVYSGSERVNADGRIEYRIPSAQHDLARVLLTRNVVGESSVGIVRRAALDAAGWFDERLPSQQDLDLWVRLTERFPADFVPEPLVRITKRRDPGRISENVAGAIAGRNLFGEKHRSRMCEYGVWYRFIRDNGWVHLRRAADARAARACYRASIAANPSAPLTYVLLLVACLPMSWLDRLAGVKHKVVDLLRGAQTADDDSAHAHLIPASLQRRVR